MYAKDGTVYDRREQLRVKLKALGAEARIIRKEEARVRVGVLREELHLHRVLDVRKEARHAHLAYGLLRGRTYEQMERTARRPPDWRRVQSLCKKYGGEGFVKIDFQPFFPVPVTPEAPELQKAA